MPLRIAIYFGSILTLSVLCLLKWWHLQASQPQSQLQLVQEEALRSVAINSQRLQSGDAFSQSAAAENLADAYRRLGRWSDAESCLQQLARSLTEQGELLQYQRVAGRLAQLYCAWGRYGEALRDYTLIFEMDRVAPDSVEEVARDLNNVGVAVGLRALPVVDRNERLRQIDGAEDCFKRALEHATSSKREFMLGVTRQNMQVLRSADLSED